MFRNVVRALVMEGRPVDAVPAGAKAELVLDQTPFYAEAGGFDDSRNIAREMAPTAEHFPKRLNAMLPPLHASIRRQTMLAEQQLSIRL